MKRVVILLLAIVCCAFCFNIEAQLSSMRGMSNSSSSVSEQPAKPKVNQYQGDVFRGLSVQADIGSPIISLLGGNARSYEVLVDVNLYRRIFPVFEIGYATAEKELISKINYNTKAPFFRLGVNYVLMKPFKDDGSPRNLKSYPFVGVRYAFSPMWYNLENIIIDDEYWGTSEILGLNNKIDYSGWVELVGGVRVDLFKGLTLGWSVRFKTLMHTSAPNKSYVWYVPGYGKSSGMGFTFNYTIGYTFYTGSDTK